MNTGDPQSFNRYSYVTNQPTNYIDPSGLLSSMVCAELGRFTTGFDTRNPQGWILYSCHIFDSPDNGGSEGGVSGGGGMSGGQNDKNEKEFCKRLANKIKNLGEKIARAVTNLMANPNQLPDQPPFLGAPPKMSQQGHRDLLGNYQDQLDINIATYKKRCGGDPPSSGRPAREPATNGVPVSDNVKKGVAVGAGVVIGVIIIKKAAGAGLLFTPAAPVGVLLIATP